MKQRVLAVNPWFPFPDFSHRTKYDSEAEVPLGLLSIVSFIEQQYPARFLDLGNPRKFGRDNWARMLAEVVRDFKPTIALVPGHYTIKYTATLQILAKLRELDPSLLLVTGGTHASALPVRMLDDSPALDVVVRYEGEWTARKIVESYDGTAESVSKIAGTVVRTKDGYVDNGMAPAGDLSQLPLINYSHIDMSELRMIPMVTSRGCPYKCKFCAEHSYFGSIRRYPVERTLEELRVLKQKHGVKGVGFEDSMFFMKSKYFNQLFDGLAGAQLGMHHYILARCDSITREGVRKLRDLKIAMMLGIESVSPKVLQTIDKRITADDAEAALALSREEGVWAGSFWIVGLPGSSAEEERLSRQFVKRILKQDIAGFFEVSQFVPYPGTETFDRYQEFGINVLSWDWERWGRWRTAPVIEYAHYPAREIARDYQRLLQTIYLNGGLTLQMQDTLLNKAFYKAGDLRRRLRNRAQRYFHSSPRPNVELHKDRYVGMEHTEIGRSAAATDTLAARPNARSAQL